jgi:hypothetical protein
MELTSFGYFLASVVLQYIPWIRDFPNEVLPKSNRISHLFRFRRLNLYHISWTADARQVTTNLQSDER